MALCLCAIEGSHIEVWLDEGLYLVARGVLPKLKCKISLLVRLLIFASANVQWRSVGVDLSAGTELAGDSETRKERLSWV